MNCIRRKSQVCNQVNNHITKSINNSIHLLLNKFGVVVDDPNVIETATEAFINYIELLGKISSSISLAAGRTQINIVDMKKSIKILDFKRYKRIFSDEVEMENCTRKKSTITTINYSKVILPDIHVEGEVRWKDLHNDSNPKGNKVRDSELFEFVDSTPKHIPDFLPIFPPRLDYCDNKFAGSF
ncbi:hypothetical protein HWI79_1429 [Cryptosporidium felis]|nr:hypothetical protein HWI79_1429 [Cryptosporidium felis]